MAPITRNSDKIRVLVSPYPQGKATDPAGPQDGKRRVARGGCYKSGAGAEHLPEDKGFKLRYIRSASRNHFLPELRMSIIGVRVVLGPEIKESSSD